MLTCPQCGKEFERTSNKQKWCTPECRAASPEFKEREKTRSRIRTSQRSIARHIRDEALSQPTRGSKMLWDGFGDWDPLRRTRECLECGTTVYVHRANGLCTRCYEQLRQRDAEELKEKMRQSQEKANERRRMALEWIRMAKEGEIERTPKIENLLDNLERLTAKR